jgi:S-adenosylmethionine decarboxylase
VRIEDCAVSTTLGIQLLVELYGCDAARLDDEEFLRAHGAKAAETMGATVVAVHSHRFEPVGVSVVVVLAESHLALHTWPEHRTASVDIFVCSRQTDPHRAKDHLADSLHAERSAELELPRGPLDRERAGRWHQCELPVSRRSRADGNA